MSKSDTPSGYSWTAISDVSVGDPTKASWGNSIKENIQWLSEASTICHIPNESYTEDTPERLGGGMIYVQSICQCTTSDIVVLHDPSINPWPDDWRYRYIQPFISSARLKEPPSNKESIKKYMPGGQYADHWNDDTSTFWSHFCYLGFSKIATAVKEVEQPFCGFYSGSGGDDKNWRKDIEILYEGDATSENYTRLMFFVNSSTGTLCVYVSQHNGTTSDFIAFAGFVSYSPKIPMP